MSSNEGGRKTRLSRPLPGMSLKPPADAPKKQFELAVMMGPDTGKSFPVEGAVVKVGYAPENQIQLTDEAVSGEHFVVEETEKGHRLRDLGSTNGTRLNGVPVVEAFLAPGCEIWVGDTRLRFQPRSPR